MRNSLFSSLPSQSQLYNFAGNNDDQMPNMGISMQVDSIVTNVQRNDFSMDSKLLIKDDNQLRSDGSGFAVSYQSLINYQQGYQSITTSCDNVSQQSFLLNRMCSLPQFDHVDFGSLQNARTDAIEANELLSQESITNANLAFNKTALKVSKKISNKKKIKVDSFCEEQWRCRVNDTSTQIQEPHTVPIRRTHKLSDKITALQKLVSPFGKVVMLFRINFSSLIFLLIETAAFFLQTDTASVLQEASLYIKLVQDQIQMLSGSYKKAHVPHSQEMGEEQLDLRSRGLCLIPISLTQKVTQEDLLEPRIVSRNTMMDKKF